MSLRTGNLRFEIFQEVFKLNPKLQVHKISKRKFAFIVEIISLLVPLNSLSSRKITVCKFLWLCVNLKRLFLFIYLFFFLSIWVSIFIQHFVIPFLHSKRLQFNHCNLLILSGGVMGSCYSMRSILKVMVLY